MLLVRGIFLLRSLLTKDTLTKIDHTVFGRNGWIEMDLMGQSWMVQISVYTILKSFGGLVLNWYVCFPRNPHVNILLFFFNCKE